MRIAFIHQNKKLGTGAHFINDLIVEKLKEKSVEVLNFYPQFMLADAPVHFKGINNILFFYSLMEKRDEILRCDIIQGTTYTPLAFLRFSKPVVSHFGSTTIGFLRSVPKTDLLEENCAEILYRLKKDGAINELNIKTRRPLNDIASIENYAVNRADYIIATSEVVRKDLLGEGVAPDKIEVIHNAIEDYWFESPRINFNKRPGLVFLGRIGEDCFTLKLKGVDRLIKIFELFPKIEKLSIVMSRNKRLTSWMSRNIPNHSVIANAVKDSIPNILKNHRGDIALITSRYEGFSLSLVELMSQGLVPIAFPVGIAPEIIRDGENGFIVHNITEAEEKIKLLLSNHALRRCLAIKSEKTAEKFKPDILIEKTLNLYQRILKNKQI